MDLRRFEPGQMCEVGSSVGALMLAEGWAEPLREDAAVPVPFSEQDPYTARVIDKSSPPNLVRETYPPSADESVGVAADFERRRRRRR
jgi:hypothetical protein